MAWLAVSVEETFNLLIKKERSSSQYRQVAGVKYKRLS